VQGYDENRNVIYWNRGSETLYGYTKAEALGKKLEALIIPEYMRALVIAGHQNWLENGVEIPSSELTLCDKNGNDVHVFSSHVMYVNQRGEQDMYCIDIDLAELKKVEARAVFKEHMLEAVFAATPDLFFLISEHGTILDYHASDEQKLYLPRKEFINKNMAGVLPEKVNSLFKTHINNVIVHGGVSSFEYELDVPAGLAYFEARVSHLKEHKQLVVIVRDITEQYKSAEVIRKQAYYDTLTSLPNRFLSLQRLSEMLKEAENNEEKTVVLFIDLDDFKKVNDSLGHEVGDKLLIQAAKRIKLAVRKSDTVGRLGGDEFIVLLRGLPNTDKALTLADNLLNKFREPFVIDNRELILTLSIGIAIYPENGDCASDLLRNADTAMYQAKAQGRNVLSFFTAEMNDTMKRRFEVEGQLHNALERNEFEVFYQPKVDIKTGGIIGAEALLRWNNATLGSVTPDEFIPIAEHTGLIVAIGKYVIKEALTFLRRWRSAHQKDYSIAINLSPRQFRDNELICFIKKSLDDNKICAANVEFEITEGVLMIGKSYIDIALNELNQLGIKLSMDDFGTGYSSLSYLRQYVFDVLKVDRSFINSISTNKADCDLVKATIAMAHSLNLLVVAEGVETQEQLAILNRLGCDIAQGYYFSKPVPASNILNMPIG
jgi:diguanylate cyclase (GGDEF)-like protein/PAS domain S-box-containing protein